MTAIKKCKNINNERQVTYIPRVCVCIIPTKNNLNTRFECLTISWIRRFGLGLMVRHYLPPLSHYYEIKRILSRYHLTDFNTIFVILPVQFSGAFEKRRRPFASMRINNSQ